jgi:uncharacterized protein YdhG (YjbR/CyaY superfamily)
VAIVDDYLATLAPEQAAALAHVRDVVLDLVPDAGETTTYAMPAFTYRGKPVLAFQAWKHHVGLYPCSSAAVAAVSDVLAAGQFTKGAIRFAPDDPLPDDVLRRVLEARTAEIDERAHRTRRS